ncbi:hypothetical protein ACOMHN_019723 [Nucella lapillus]
MSHNHIDKEQECVLHWFRGWSQYQKQDFFKFLMDRACPPNVDTLFDAMHSLNMRDQSPSIFQCQLKLLGEWFTDWTEMEKDNFVIKLATIDSDFVRRFNNEVEKAVSEICSRSLMAAYSGEEKKKSQ